LQDRKSGRRLTRINCAAEPPCNPVRVAARRPQERETGTMTYRTLLVATDRTPGAAARLETAFALARRFDAHVSLLGFGVQEAIPGLGYSEFSGEIIARQAEQARSDARAAEAAAREALARAGLRGDAAAEIGFIDAILEMVGRHARYADLVVLGGPEAPGAAPEAGRVLDGALFRGDAPVLVCPERLADPVGSTVLVAWDGGLQAHRAVRGALPFLVSAGAVHIALVDPEIGPDANGEEPGADVALWLTRHGVRATVERLASAGRPVHAVLREAARDRGADLIVMGAWSHSRFREFILGGPTRDMLRDVACPVLMAH
jgi:nucleotide-binding universal stress UspA family protein